MKKKPFNFRAFTTLAILWTLIIDAVSGLVLYTVPSGRIADWTNWTFAGFAKSEWETIHTVFSYIFLLFISLHLYNNWHSILHYIKRKFKQYTKARIELYLSLLVVIILLGGTIASIPPFSSVMDLGSLIKDAWPENKDAKGINIKDPGQSLKKNADRNKISPSRIYTLLKEIIPPEKHITVPKLLHK